MSKHYAAHTAVSNVWHDISTMPVEQLEEKYQIEIDDQGGAVWDHLEGLEFEDLDSWAQYTATLEQEDNYAQVDRIGRKDRYDDGGY